MWFSLLGPHGFNTGSWYRFMLMQKKFNKQHCHFPCTIRPRSWVFPSMPANRFPDPWMLAAAKKKQRRIVFRFYCICLIHLILYFWTLTNWLWTVPLVLKSIHIIPKLPLQAAYSPKTIAKHPFLFFETTLCFVPCTKPFGRHANQMMENNN